MPLPSHTFGGYALIRSNLAGSSDADIAKAVAYGKRLKVYPLAQAANPPPTKFTDATGVVFDSTIPYDLRYFQSLDRIIQTEPWLERDKAMIDSLRSIGIEKGKAFYPDEKAKATFDEAAHEAHDWLDHLYGPRCRAISTKRTGRCLRCRKWWRRITGYADPNSYPTDARAVTYSVGYIGIKRLGAGQFYLMTSTDKDGQPLMGSNSYCVTVPAKAPASLYWSATAYDRATHALIRDMSTASRSYPARNRTATDRLISISDQTLRPAESRTGFQVRPAGDSKSSSASMALRSRCSIRVGRYRTSRGLDESAVSKCSRRRWRRGPKQGLCPFRSLGLGCLGSAPGTEADFRHETGNFCKGEGFRALAAARAGRRQSRRPFPVADLRPLDDNPHITSR